MTICTCKQTIYEITVALVITQRLRITANIVAIHRQASTIYEFT